MTILLEDEREFTTLRSQISDAERFAECDPLRFKCRSCTAESIFDGLIQNTVSNLLNFRLLDRTDTLRTQAGLLTSGGIRCSNSDCFQPLSIPSLAVQLDLQIRSHISKFYEGWLVCDDQSCGNRTRMMSVYGKRCLVASCRGKMHYEVRRFSNWRSVLADFVLRSTPIRTSMINSSHSTPYSTSRRLVPSSQGLIDSVCSPFLLQYSS